MSEVTDRARAHILVTYAPERRERLLEVLALYGDELEKEETACRSVTN